MKDDQEITDEELQRLIDINEADSGEPDGISPRRRSKLLRDTENRIREYPLFQKELAKAKQKTEPAKANGLLLTDEETALALAYTAGDPIIEYFIDCRGALLRGASADEIDTLTEDWAKHYGIDLDALDEGWVGTEHLKLKQIRRIKDKAEKDAAIETLAVENLLKRKQQEARQPVDTFTDEWYEEHIKPFPLLIRIKHFFKYFFVEQYSDLLWKSALQVIVFLGLYLLFGLPFALLGILLCFALGINYDWGFILVILLFYSVVFIVWLIRRIKRPA